MEKKNNESRKSGNAGGSVGNVAGDSGQGVRVSSQTAATSAPPSSSPVSQPGGVVSWELSDAERKALKVELDNINARRKEPTLTASEDKSLAKRAAEIRAKLGIVKRRTSSTVAYEGRVTVSVTPMMEDWYQRLSEKTGKSVSVLAREALERDYMTRAGAYELRLIDRDIYERSRTELASGTVNTADQLTIVGL